MIKNILSLFIMKAYAARTSSVDPLQKFKFRLTVPGLPSGIGFQKVSGLSEEVDVSEYDEGGYEYTHKMPGKVKVPEVTAERGAYADDSFRALFERVLTDRNYRNTIILEVMARNGEVARTYKLAEAWVSKWEGSDFDASSSDVAIEKLTIQFEHFI